MFMALRKSVVYSKYSSGEKKNMEVNLGIC